jgi:hypothetical protein
VQACGDAHVANFGKFATPERSLVFDINDFDETLPGPWEWDVAPRRQPARGRPPAGLRSDAGRRRGHGVDTRLPGTHGRVQPMRLLQRWYARTEVDDVIAHFPAKYRPQVGAWRRRRKITAGPSPSSPAVDGGAVRRGPAAARPPRS